MATLDSLTALRNAWHRLTGTTSDDDALTENGEGATDVVDLCLTHGFWAAQRHLIANGMANRWRKRSAALSFSGSDTADGGRYTDLPDDFLRLSGDETRSSIVRANGDRWGTLITGENDSRRGSYYYLKNDQLWLARGADVPTTAYLDYQYRHPEITTGVALDFPLEVRMLGVAYGAEVGMAEGWFPYDESGQAKITRAVTYWESQGRKTARESREPRRTKAGKVIGTHHFAFGR